MPSTGLWMDADMNQLIEYSDITREAWKHLEDAGDDPTHPMRLLTLATVDEQGAPDARLLVLRGASRENRRLWFHTDCRSKKAQQLQHQPEVCVVGYDNRDDVQLRVFGTTRLHHGNEIAEQHWMQTNIAVRNMYGSSNIPGASLPEHDPRVHRHQVLMDTELAEVGRYNFLVIALIVDRIDWVQVNGPLQRRALLRSETDWKVQPLAP